MENQVDLMPQARRARISEVVVQVGPGSRGVGSCRESVALGAGAGQQLVTPPWPTHADRHPGTDWERLPVRSTTDCFMACGRHCQLLDGLSWFQQYLNTKVLLVMRALS